MFETIVAQSLRNRLLVLALAAALVLTGLLALTRLPVDVLPDLNRPTVTVMTEAEGLAPPEVEQRVTYPIETRMNGLPGVTRVRSVSGIGLSIVTVEFAWDADLYRARQFVAERLALARTELPADVMPQMGPVSSIMGGILLVAVTSETASPMQLRETADFTIRPRLLAIPGVAQVIPIGGAVRQYRVAPNPAAMRALGVTHAAMTQALEGFGTNAGGGFTDAGAREVLIRAIGRTIDLDDLRNLVIGTPAGPVYLRQVAEVDFAPRPRRGDGGYMGKPAVIVSVEKQPGVDTVRLTRTVEEALAQLGPSLPPGIRAQKILFRQADFIETSLHNVVRVLLEAVAVVAVVLFAFLMNARTTLISLTAIPVSILATAAIFSALGLSINTMTLGGLAIAIGELVDDAVVDVENILRRLRENRHANAPRSSFAVIVAASNEVRSGIVYATVIICLVFVPLFALSGIEGRLFAPLGQAYIIAILSSLAVSLTLTPALASWLLPGLKGLEAPEGRLIRGLKAGNGRLVAFALNHQRGVMAAALLGVGAAALAATALPRAFLPAFNEGSFTVNLAFTPGISLAESSRIGAIAEGLVLEIPEVERVGRRTGRAELDEHAEGVHSTDLEIGMKTGTRPGGRPREAVVADLRARLGVLPVSVNIGQPISHRLDHMLSGVRAEIALKLFGEDLDGLRRTADALKAEFETIPGLTDLAIEKQVRIPQLEVRVDSGRAALYGIAPGAVVEAVSRLANGRVVSTLVDGLRRYDVTLRLPESGRSVAALRDLLIETPTGWVPAHALADIAERDGPNQILRENGRRRLVVQANTQAGTDGAAVARAVAETLARTTLPQGITASLEGAFQAQGEATRTIGLLSLVSLALVFALLASRYRSGVLALIVMGNVPLALIGSVAALFIAGLPLSVASMIGFVTLTGIVARNGILKISHVLNLGLAEGLPFGPALVLRASNERLVPVLMTALAAGIALVPLLVDGTAPGKEILHPVAVTIFGGLLSATLLDAVLTPVLVLRFGAGAFARLAAARVPEPAHAAGAPAPALF
ncbi:efflux RND transporter permease subunit [Methylobacterium sp. J-068]|uniref:efflux RND transporter permease subunit n=1 Tax=Methylobacterium sp. J-068 TaxID=2836649 RepID=UPI001FB8B963|nr:efflux RND transporter permease subunit [Methylobacterium sp. J-068]MCJ2036182.1 efflux RND transporter permease subunit [Methylobacterium sp. J-068]